MAIKNRTSFHYMGMIAISVFIADIAIMLFINQYARSVRANKSCSGCSNTNNAYLSGYLLLLC